MNIIYYVEINLICIIILFLFYNQIQNKYMQQSEAELVLRHLIITAIVFCLSDMIAGIFRGQLFSGARIIIEFSNLIYDESLVIIAYLWMKFVHIRINKIEPLKNNFLVKLPLIIFTLAAITNPFTNFLFSINEKNLYVRGSGIIFHWIITYSYFVITTIQVIKLLILEKSKLKRQEIIPLAYFFIAPLICSLIQMVFYGISSTQVGVSISLVMICLSYQSNRILTDTLTGLNNRRGLEHFLHDFTLHYPKTNLTFLLIDLNKFKLINDKYGHSEGDNALCHTAEVLKDVCKGTTKRPFLCRYGGDEFVLALINEDIREINRIEKDINEKFKEKMTKKKTPYVLSVSIGISSGCCSNIDDARKLISIADEAMYENKKQYKLNR
ncbi:MAG: GGDEF domain-containing protein [Lachnospiraceae bacterium]|nr:GGDEF domain-containing protein [Lachnospiraceae bacterium]MDD3617058.1 GGDEF domain-containing protein [Lachnospiraceae bacterium]